ncbi:serine/threonine protein phosphatase [Ancylobacter dichloromethanicus]|uniref:Metallophosphoesterase n=1 Tax=Ancylobacter dichloromethanicus TaxID=518825 RepID=A0A9W6JCI6_9HYPH|nr:metallophosphoesterase family protein [Ancylobacter dichloromethanicus]MBS7552083.1 serine/threonine protein phosphatase [Ancylobacter dichloromethanicus]GLK74747.1 metallophosphoesterase [Ancylobacter dichloromethanicus]
MLFSRFRAPETRRAPARIPDGVRVYAIGDIHGRHDLLTTLLAAIAADAADTRHLCRTVFLGDYVDRGEDSAGVIERLSASSAADRAPGDAAAHADAAWTCLMGNHEAMMLAALSGEADCEPWLRMGGAETLFSYGVSVHSFIGPDRAEQVRAAALAAIPAAHFEFLRQLPGKVEIGDYYFCHAGIRPGVALDQQTLDDLIWIREDFTRSPLDHGKRIVHGHTPAMEVELLANRINVDTGAYLTHRLSCVVLEGEEARVIHT